MNQWLTWLIRDERNRFAWAITGAQAIMVLVGHTPLLWSGYLATIFALWLIAGTFLLLGRETFKATQAWNGVGRSLTLLAITIGLAFIPPAVGVTYQVAIGEYRSVYSNDAAQAIRDITYIAGVFAPGSLLCHLRHTRKVSRTTPS